MYEFSPFGANFLPRLIPSSGKTYDFRDEFKTALAAASVNATSCEPGPGTRTVTDSEGKLSIANGKLTFAGGKASPAYGDPGYWRTGAITRNAGTILALSLYINTAGTFQFGLDSGRSASAPYGFQLSANNIRFLDNYNDNATIHQAIASNTLHKIVIVVRSSGLFYFISVNGSRFKLLYSNTLSNSSSFYLSLNNYSLAGTVDFIRIPRTKWLPTPLLSDSFAAADATSNNNRTSDGLGHLETTGLGSGGSGVVWSGASGAIQSNRLVITPTLGSELSSGSTSVGSWYKVTATTSNYFGTGVLVDHVFRATTTKTIDANNRVKLVTFSSGLNYVSQSSTDIEITTKFQRIAGTQAGIVIGLNDAGTSFVLIYDNGAGYVKVDKCVAGTYTQLQNASMTYVADAELKVSRRTQADGTSEIWAWYNNTLVGTAAAILSAGAENTALSGLKVGLFSTYQGNSFDSCMVYNVGTNNEFSILDRLIGN
jgi:hypothetical protein